MGGFLPLFGFALGLALLSGFRAFFPLVFLGLLSRFAAAFDLRPPFNVLTSTWILIILLFFLVWELMSEKWPVGGVTRSAIFFPIRVVAGGILAAAVLTGPGGILAFLAGAALAGLGVWFSIMLRPAVAAYFQEYRIAVLSSLEDVLAVAGFALLLLVPWVTYPVIGIIIFFFVKKIKEGSGQRPPRRDLR